MGGKVLKRREEFSAKVGMLLYQKGYLVFSEAMYSLLLPDLKSRKIEGVSFPCIIACSPEGRFVAVARKSPRNKELLMKINELGGLGIMVDNVEELEADLNSLQ